MSGSLVRQMLLVFLAGGAGATLRVLLATAVERAWGPRLPDVGVLAVNLLGCLLIGVASPVVQGPWRAVWLGGLLGGFTTYSAFALFSVGLAQDGRYGVLATQIGLHLVGGMLCVWLGASLARAAGLAA